VLKALYCQIRSDRRDATAVRHPEALPVGLVRATPEDVRGGCPSKAPTFLCTDMASGKTLARPTPVTGVRVPIFDQVMTSVANTLT
jgi:hypothetical protein